jgi:predicted SprT family Zn-dependent metalloprotease
LKQSEVFSAKLIKTSSKHPLDHFNLWQFDQGIYGRPKHWKRLLRHAAPAFGHAAPSTRTSGAI